MQALGLSWAETNTLSLRDVRFMLDTLEEQDEQERKANGQSARPQREPDHRGVVLTPMN